MYNFTQWSRYKPPDCWRGEFCFSCWLQTQLFNTDIASSLDYFIQGDKFVHAKPFFKPRFCPYSWGHKSSDIVFCSSSKFTIYIVQSNVSFSKLIRTLEPKIWFMLHYCLISPALNFSLPSKETIDRFWNGWMAGRNFVKWKAENSPEKGQAPAFQTQRLI